MAFWVLPPPVAVMTMGKVPRVARLDSETVMEMLPDPGAAMGLGDGCRDSRDAVVAARQAA